MCSMSVLCPLCAQTSFTSIDALRCSLIKAANGPLACPICHELFLGLDKLTIHLFSHTNIMNANDSSSSSRNNKSNTNDIKQIPKIISEAAAAATTTQQSVNTIIGSSNSHHIGSDYNNEKFKTKEKALMAGEQTVAHQPNDSVDVSFENTHHPSYVVNDNLTQTAPQGAPMKKTKLSKANAKQQQPQVSPDADTDTTPASGPPQPTCDICEFTFRNEELRDMHIRLVHQNFAYENIVNTLSHHGQVCQNAQLASQPTELEFKCHLCSKTFKMKGSLRVHLKVVHLMGLPYVNNSPKLNICDRIRHKESKQLKALNVVAAAAAESTTSTTITNTNNLYNLHPISLIPNLSNCALNSTQNLGNISVLNITPSTEFTPNIMDPSKSLNSSVVFVLHNNSNSSNNNNNHHHQQQQQQQQQQQIGTNPTTDTDINSSLLSSSNLNASVSMGFAPTTTTTTAALANSDNAKIWECDVCSKAFTTKYFLKKHKRLHTGEMPYTCELCGRTFTFQQSYHKHLLYHSDEKPHVCSTCGRAFKELSTLHNHERIHSGEKPFKCDVCGKSFRQRVSFLVHTRIHTGVMPYKCETCQKSFRYKVSQRTHKCQSATSAEEATIVPAESTNLDHMSESFIKVFLENSANTNASLEHPPPLSSPASNEIAAINEKIATPSSSTSESLPSTLNEQQALLSKTIDDIVVESCNKLGIGNRSATMGFTPVADANEGSLSPSQKLQNMRLYSPQMVTPDMNGIEGDLTRFFLENSEDGENIL